MANLPDNVRSLGLWDAVSIGVGGMVGGGIFAVLGLAVQLAGGGTPIAFTISGLVALITSYSYAKLSVKYPCQGGTVEFLNIAFGHGLLAGGLNILLMLSYIIMLSLYAYAFGSYGAIYFPPYLQVIGKHLLICLVIVIFTVLNIFNAKIVGESERLIVFIKIVILLGFLLGGVASGTNVQNLQLANWPGILHILAGGMIIFVAYEGFELIANTAQDIRDPQKNIPRAYFTAVGFVVVLYVAISIVTLGTLSFNQIADAKDYALAAAARPLFGNFGFVLITVAALLSTASAINATLYGASRISYILAKEGELPEKLEEKIWNKPLEGLFITSGLTLIVANSFDLTSISTMGSSGFLLIFLAINTANVLLYKETQSSAILSILGAVACLLALAALLWQTIHSSSHDLLIFAGMIGLSFAFEAVFRNYRKIINSKLSSSK